MKRRITLITFIMLVCFNGVAHSQTNNSNSAKKTNDKPLMIKNKPRVPYTEGLCQKPSGLVSIRVTFDKSEKITNAEIVKSSGCDRFDKDAVSAAKKIKFSPAIKNGEPVTVSKIVQYTFQIF